MTSEILALFIMLTILALFIMSEILAYMFSLHYRPFSVHIMSLMHYKSSSLNAYEYFSINTMFL